MYLSATHAISRSPHSSTKNCFITAWITCNEQTWLGSSKHNTNIGYLENNYLINELFKNYPRCIIYNNVNMFTEHLKANRFSLEFNYRDIYHIVINKLISIKIVIFLHDSGHSGLVWLNT